MHKMNANEQQLDIVELQRRLFNLIKFGTVHSADYPKSLIRVEVGGNATGWLPWLTRRAGASTEWWAPEVGEQVVVLSPCGDPAQAVVLPSLYSNAHPAPSADPKIRRTNYSDGSFVEYNETTHKMTITVNGGDVALNTTGNLDAVVGGKADVTAGGAASVIADTISLDGGGAVKGLVQGDCRCAITGQPHPQISATVKASK